MTEIENIRQLGVSKNASSVYLASLKYGISQVKDLSKETGLVRQLVYEAINELVHKGLIIKEPYGRSRFRYIPAEPQVLLDLIKSQEQNLAKIIPDLEAMYRTSKTTPLVRIYDNIITCREIERRLLKEYNEKEEVLIQSSVDIWYKLDPVYNDYFLVEKDKTGVKTKLLSSKDETAVYLSKKKNYEVKILAKNLISPADYVIFKDLVWIMSMDKNNIHAITIESKPIAEMHRNLFYAIWNRAKRLE
ncbi:MAG: hypothetical protein M1338_04770 [Patescibacteria group bacterium]|nr:hypothetical protein [Patescibacteria group bacterium]